MAVMELIEAAGAAAEAYAKCKAGMPAEAAEEAAAAELTQEDVDAEIAAAVTANPEGAAEAAEDLAEAGTDIAEAGADVPAEPEKKGTRNPFKKVVNATQMLGGIKGEISGGIQQFKDVRAAKKVLDEARNEVLNGADLTFSLIDYAKGVQREGRDNRLLDIFDVTQIDDKCGAFVIATYKRLDLDKDLADYNGVYVGMGEDIREEIDFVISRKGDPDVYADVKYFQNVRFYLFECEAGELQARYDGLMKAFYDERLYND